LREIKLDVVSSLIVLEAVENLNININLILIKYEKVQYCIKIKTYKFIPLKF